MKAFLSVAASVLAIAAANCPNACSGHGLCALEDQCRCDPTYMGADCSQRACPFDYSFVDTPRGDLNHNGVLNTGSVGSSYASVAWSNVKEFEMFPMDATVYAASNNEAHFYSECSNKGNCNRDTGVCACLPGYTGAACQRTVCPKDCSGHGVCRTISEITAGALNKFSYKSLGGHRYFTGVRTAFSYDRWDGNKHQSCICDAGFSGYDCGAKLCPRGDDPLTQGPASCGGATCTWDIQSFTLADTTATTYRLGMTNSYNATVYAYAELDTANAANGWVPLADRASKLSGPTTVAGILQDALRALPGGLFQRVEVYPAGDAGVTPGADITRTFRVTFVGVAGNQEQLTVDSIYGPGRMWLNPDHTSYPLAASRAVVTLARGNYEELECSGRGLCDSSSGLCKCFAGFTGESCSIQNALPM